METAMSEPNPVNPVSQTPLEGRLESWKEIADYLKRDVTTVQRWEKREGMPVHRHVHDRMGSVYASRSELDAWKRTRNLRAAQETGITTALLDPPAQPSQVEASTPEVAPNPGSDSICASDIRRPVATQIGFLLAQPFGQSAFSDGLGF